MSGLPQNAIEAINRDPRLSRCERCGSDYERARGYGLDSAFCSWTCLKIANRQLLEAGGRRSCPACGKPLGLYADWRAAYCSPACKARAQRAREAQPKPLLIERACEQCGNVFTPKLQPSAKFCSRRCANAAGNARRNNLDALPAKPRTDAEREADLMSRRPPGTAAALAAAAKSLPVFTEAACRDHPELPLSAWDNDRDSLDKHELQAKAIAACNSCPELVKCREWAMSFPADKQFGIQGGMTAKARAAEIRRHRRAATSAA